MATCRREKFAPQTRIRARRRTLLKKSRNLQIRKKACAKSRIFAHFEVYSAKPYKIRLYYTILPLGIFPSILNVIKKPKMRFFRSQRFRQSKNSLCLKDCILYATRARIYSVQIFLNLVKKKNDWIFCYQEDELFYKASMLHFRVNSNIKH